MQGMLLGKYEKETTPPDPRRNAGGAKDNDYWASMGNVPCECIEYQHRESRVTMI
jgi:hypothetical protein